MRTNELAFLKANFTKPVSWRLTRSIGGDRNKNAYTLDFTYLQPQDWGEFQAGDKWLSHWVSLHTRRGDVKLYKSADAALSDARAVQGDDTEVVIYFRDC